jgi:hypothetical protein
MTSRPPSAAAGNSRPAHSNNPTPHTTSRIRSHSSTARLPPHAPKPSRRQAASSSASSSSNSLANPVFNIGPPTLIPRASCGKPDDILAPPDAQSCPFAKAGLKVAGMGTGPYGELDGTLEWPPELYEQEHREAQIASQIKAIYTQDERLRSKGTSSKCK